MSLNVKPTSEVIREMADHLQFTAKKLNRLAEDFERTDDFDYASEVLSEIRNLHLALRTDLLLTRPLREFQRELDESKSKVMQKPTSEIRFGSTDS